MPTGETVMRPEGDLLTTIVLERVAAVDVVCVAESDREYVGVIDCEIVPRLLDTVDEALFDLEALSDADTVSVR